MKTRSGFVLLVAASTVALAQAASAGQVVPAKMSAAAQMQVSEGILNGCGLRVVAVAEDGSATSTAVDFSFNFYRSGNALVKAGVRMARMDIPKEVEAPPIRPIVGFWLRTPGHSATMPNKAGIIKSDSPKGYLLYGTTVQAVAPLFGAAFEGQPIQVGFRLAGEDVERILSGTIEEAGTELKEVSQCMGELTAAMQKDVEAAQANGK